MDLGDPQLGQWCAQTGDEVECLDCTSGVALAIARLPKPGVWMEIFKQAMAFPLLATVVWLLWVLGSQVGNDGVAQALAGLVIIALSAWIYGRLQVARPLAAAIVAIPMVLAGIYVAWNQCGLSCGAQYRAQQRDGTRRQEALRRRTGSNEIAGGFGDAGRCFWHINGAEIPAGRIFRSY